MPLFEMQCQDCGKRFTTLVGVVSDQMEDGCPHCGSKRVSKLVSRFSRGRSEDDRVDEVADRLELMGEPDSPSAMKSMVRDLGAAFDDDMTEDLEQMLDSDMSGEGSSDAEEF